MGRNRMSVHSMSESTKHKYSQAQLKEMEAREEEVKESFQSSYLEEVAKSSLSKEEDIKLYESYKKILTGLMSIF